MSRCAPAGPEPYRIAVLGDSLSAQNALMPPAWPALLEAHLRASPRQVEVYNASVPAHTWYRAREFIGPFDGQTALERVLAVQPHLLVVSLGFNDTWMAVDGRSLAQVQADASATIAYVRSQQPSLPVLYLSQLVYDRTHVANVANLVNRHVMGVFQTAPVTSGNLGTAVSATIIGRAGDWLALDAHVRGLVDATTEVDLWRIHRIGGALPDRLHLLGASAQFQMAYALKGVRSFLQGITTPSNAQRNDFDAMFLDAFTDTGTAWMYSPGAQAINVLASHGNVFDEANWFSP